MTTTGTSANEQRPDHPRVRARVDEPAPGRDARAAGSSRPGRRRRAGPGSRPSVIARSRHRRRAAGDAAGDHVDDDRDREEHDAEADERGVVQPGRLGEVVHDHRRHRVAGAEEVRRDLVAAADDERDRDRLAHRAPEAEHRRADEPAAHAREHRDAQHLPPGRAHRDRAVLVVLGDGDERLARQAT